MGSMFENKLFQIVKCLLMVSLKIKTSQFTINHLTKPFMLSGLFYHNSLDWSTSNTRVSGKFLLLHVPCFVEIPMFNANRVDPDQMLYSTASDLGLHYLPMSLLAVSRLKWAI